MDTMLVFILAVASVPAILAVQPDIKYIGCFHIPDTAVQYSYSVTINNLATQCVNRCYVDGSQYAALNRLNMYSCRCGRDTPFVSEKQSDSECHLSCSGNTSLSCGSYEYYSVYEILNFRTAIDVDNMEGFIFGFMQGVQFINLTTPNDPQPILTTQDRVKYVDFHWNKQKLFASTHYKLHSSSLKGGENSDQILSLPTSMCEAFAVDWVHDKIIWADCDDKVTIKISKLDGSEPVTILTRKINAFTRVQVDPSAGKIFWSTAKAIESCDNDGRNLQTNLTRTDLPLRGLTLDIPSKRVFFVGLNMENGSGTLYSIKYSGEQLTTHWNCRQMISIYGLDVFRGNVYWTNYEGKDVIYAAPLEDVKAMRKIAVVNKSVWHIRLVHPELQPRGSADPCQALNCSHRCVDGRCVCPDKQHLAPDKEACRGDEESLANVTYVGCFSVASDTVVGESTFHLDNVTLGMCADQCRALKTRYAAVDASSEVCRCGADIPYETTKFDDDFCDQPCPDRASSWCGGDGAHSVYDVIAENTSVYNSGVGLLVGTSEGVFVYNSSKQFVYFKSRTSSLHIDTVDYHWEKQLAFSLDSSGNFYRSPLKRIDGKNNLTVKIHSMTTCDGFAVDWVHDRIFWAHCAGDLYDYDEESDPIVTIRTIDLEGKDEKTLVTRYTDKLIRRMVVDPYARKLFWVASAHVVESCDLSGENSKVIYNITKQPGRTNLLEIFLDLAPRRIFFVVDHGGLTLSSMDYSGSDRKIHWKNVEELRYVYGLGVVNSAVYWVNWAIHKGADVLYQAPFGDPNQLQVLRDIQGVWHMRVVHPSLQSDPCAFPQCKTECDEPSSNCTICPDYCKIVFESAAAESAPVFKSVFLGFFLIAAMISLVVSLLYFSDKYWTTLRSRISQTIAPQYRQGRNLGANERVTEDNENLIDD